MSGVTIDLAETRGALSSASRRVQALIAAVPDPGVRALGLDWTLGETAAHLVADIGRFRDIALGTVVPDGGVEGVAAINSGHLVQVEERDPVALGRLVADAIRDFLFETRHLGGAENVGWYGGGKITVGAITGLVLGEVLVHGYDLATTTRQRWRIDPQEARLVLQGATWTLPSMVDGEAAVGLRATYDVRIRGGPRVLVRFEDGELAVEPYRGQGADCHISADPVAFLLVGYGRRRQWGPIVRGKLVAWGRKPWLGPRFAALVRNP